MDQHLLRARESIGPLEAVQLVFLWTCFRLLGSVGIELPMLILDVAILTSATSTSSTLVAIGGVTKLLAVATSMSLLGWNVRALATLHDAAQSVAPTADPGYSGGHGCCFGICDAYWWVWTACDACSDPSESEEESDGATGKGVTGEGNEPEGKQMAPQQCVTVER